MGRSQTIATFAVLLATCVAGILHAPWWAACAGASSLALISLLALRARAASVPELRMISEPVLVLSSLINATVAACGIFAFGHFARWVWGL